MPWLPVKENRLCLGVSGFLSFFFFFDFANDFFLGKEGGSAGPAPRECHGLPWGFPRQPAPVPVKTRTRIHGCGF